MPGDDFETSMLSFENLDRASPDLWPEQCKLAFSLLLSCNYCLLNWFGCFSNLVYPVISYTVPGVAEFAATCKNVS